MSTGLRKSEVRRGAGGRSLAARFAVLALALSVLSLSGCGPGNQDNSGSGTTSLTVTVALPTPSPSGISPLAPKGTANDVLGVAVELHDGWYGSIPSGTPDRFVYLDWDADYSVWTGTITGIPLGTTTTFVGRAYNKDVKTTPAEAIAANEIFNGYTVAALSGDDQLTLALSPIDDGNGILLPMIEGIYLPAQIGVDKTASIDFAVSGQNGETLTFQLTSGGGTFASGTTTVDPLGAGSIVMDGAGKGTINVSYTAPAGVGTYTHSITLTNSQGNSITQSFDTVVVLTVTNGDVTVLFAPVVTALYLQRIESDLVVMITVVDDKDRSGADPITWEFTQQGGTPGADFCSNIACPEAGYIIPLPWEGERIYPYDETVWGDVTITVPDIDGYQTTVFFTFPENLIPDNPVTLISDVALFANTSYVNYDPALTDPNAEASNLEASLELMGYPVGTFTGITPADFNAATYRRPVLAIPDLEVADLNAAIDASDPAAKTEIRTFVENGGMLLTFLDIGGASNKAVALLNATFGFDMTATTSVTTGTSTLNDAAAQGTFFTNGPGAIPNHDATADIVFATLPAEARAIYLDAYGDSTVTLIPFGSGTIVIMGYDWFGAKPVGSQDGGWLKVLDLAMARATGKNNTRFVAVSKLGLGTVTGTPAGIDCGVDCVFPYPTGTSVTLSAVPDTGYEFSGWSGACSGTSDCLLTMDTDQAVTATFTQLHTLTVLFAGAGGGTVFSNAGFSSCGSSCQGDVLDGTGVTLTATPAAGSEFTGWSGEGCSGAGDCTFTMDAAKTVTATFTPLHTLTVGVTGSGTVSTTDTLIACPGDCSEIYPDNTVVTFQAPEPDTGWAFTGWGGACSGSGGCTVTMDASKSVTATFTILRTLTITSSGSGVGSISSNPAGIDCPGACSYQFPEGTSVLLTAGPDVSSTFTIWTGGGCAAANPCNVTLNGDTTVNAEFTLKQFTLTVLKDGNGGGSVVGSGIVCGATCQVLQVDYDTSISLTANPAGNSNFSKWRGGGCDTANPCEFNITGNTTVTATFTLKPFTLTVAKAGTGTGTVTSTDTLINCGADCSEEYDYNTQVTLQAAAGTGAFTGWSGGGCSGTGDCVVTVTNTTTVTAQFDIVLAAAVNAGGLVTSSPGVGIECGSDCTQIYSGGTSVTLRAHPRAGYKFTGWGGNCSGTALCSLTMNTSKSVTATFAPYSASALFVDTFEDGNYTGWELGTISGWETYTREVVTTTSAADTTRSLSLTGGQTGSHMNGLYKPLANLTPAYISFYVRSSSQSATDGYVTISKGGVGSQMFFLAFASGGKLLMCHTDTICGEYNSYAVNTWYFFEIRNINWTSKTFDLYKDGAAILLGAGFRDPSTASSITRIDLHNYNPSQAWWDEFELRNSTTTGTIIPPILPPPGGGCTLVC